MQDVSIICTIHLKFLLVSVSGQNNIRVSQYTAYRARPTFYVVQTFLAEFGLYVGNLKFNTKHDRKVGIRLIIRTVVHV